MYARYRNWQRIKQENYEPPLPGQHQQRSQQGNQDIQNGEQMPQPQHNQQSPGQQAPVQQDSEVPSAPMGYMYLLVTEAQGKRLRAIADLNGLSLSITLRNLIDFYLQTRKQTSGSQAQATTGDSTLSQANNYLGGKLKQFREGKLL